MDRRKKRGGEGGRGREQGRKKRTEGGKRKQQAG